MHDKSTYTEVRKTVEQLKLYRYKTMIMVLRRTNLLPYSSSMPYLILTIYFFNCYLFRKQMRKNIFLRFLFSVCGLLHTNMS